LIYQLYDYVAQMTHVILAAVIKYF